MEGVICSRTEAVVEERVNDRFGQLASKITLAHVDDNELVQDLATRMMRRQRQDLGTYRKGSMMCCRDFVVRQPATSGMRMPRQTSLATFNVASSSGLLY